MSDLFQPFIGALQASASVLLTLFAGVLASQFELLNEEAAKNVSKFCVRMALPALLIANIGQELELASASRYLPLLLWSLVYNIISILIGMVLTKVMKLPAWTTPAMAFNNTTSLPLLLVQSLKSADVLDSILMGNGDTASEAVGRAKSYFLINAMVSNSLTFALGPKLLNGNEEDGEEKQGDDESDGEEEEANEQTSLLPDHVQHEGGKAAARTGKHAKHYYKKLHPWMQEAIKFSYSFLNAPLIGAVIGAFIGLTPPLKKAFFADPKEGGFFKAWLTTSLENVGELFAALQVIVVGVKLASAMRKSRRGEESGDVPMMPLFIVNFMRHIIWPAISIPLMWYLAKRGTLGQDPILWFCM